MTVAIRNLGSSEVSLKGSLLRESKSFSLGGGDGVSSRGGPSNKDWTSPAASVMKEVDTVISSVISEGGSGPGAGLKTSSSMSWWNLQF